MESYEKKLCIKMRKETGMGLMDCKGALNRFDYDFDKAKEYITSDAFYKYKLVNRR